MSESWERIRPRDLDPVTQRGMQVIGEWVRDARRTQGLTQQYVENLTGIDQTTQSRLENGRLGSLRLRRLARLVGTLADVERARRELW